MINNFNIRVYGLLFNAESEVLICDEIRYSQKISKFPGGGLEFGEGISDCLKREWKEETALDIQNLQLFYINDFFQISAFNTQDQIISIYYKIVYIDSSKLLVKQKQFDFEHIRENEQIFRWAKINAELENQLTFPIDKVVAGLLKNQNQF